MTAHARTVHVCPAAEVVVAVSTEQLQLQRDRQQQVMDAFNDLTMRDAAFNHTGQSGRHQDKLLAFCNQVLLTPSHQCWDGLEQWVYDTVCVADELVRVTKLQPSMCMVIALQSGLDGALPRKCSWTDAPTLYDQFLTFSEGPLSPSDHASLPLCLRRLLCVLWAGPAGARVEAVQYTTGGVDFDLQSSAHWKPVLMTVNFIDRFDLVERARVIHRIRRMWSLCVFQFDSVGAWKRSRSGEPALKSANDKGVMVLSDAEAFRLSLWISRVLAPKLAVHWHTTVQHVLQVELPRMRRTARQWLCNWDFARPDMIDCRELLACHSCYEFWQPTDTVWERQRWMANGIL